MSRIHIDFPDFIQFQTTVQVRIDDLNYGNHLSNDVYLKYMHEARMRFFQYLGLTEMDIGGCSVIMGDCGIRFNQECFYGETLLIEVTTGDIGNRSFELLYRFTKTMDGSLVCTGKTGMVCFDYQTRKTVPIPPTFVQLITPQAI